MHIFANILGFEREHISPDSEECIDRIANGVLKKTIEISKKKQGFLGQYTVWFLGESLRTESVDLLFSKIREQIELSRDQKVQVFYALSRLSAKHAASVNRHIDILRKTRWMYDHERDKNSLATGDIPVGSVRSWGSEIAEAL